MSIIKVVVELAVEPLGYESRNLNLEGLLERAKAAIASHLTGIELETGLHGLQFRVLGDLQ